MAKTKEERLQEVHARAIARFDVIHEAVFEVRLECVQDRRFYSIAGAMWEDWVGEQSANTPRFEINKIMRAVIRIFNEYRNNRITVDFRPKDENASSETADTLDGLYRADEHEFVAQEAYDNGFDEGVGGGMGAWRLRAVLEDEYSEDGDERQRIAIEPVFDADTSVFFDLDAKRYDKADARFCFVITSMTREAYDEAYPDKPCSSFDGIKLTTMFDWFTPDVVYVAEYYEVEEKTESIFVFGSTLPGQEEKRLKQADLDDADKMAVLKNVLQYHALRVEKKRSRAVHKYILNGAVTLEDSGRIAGKCIPIVPFYGKRWFVDNVERCQGEVRLSKDAQRLLNMQLSRLGELAGTAPFEVPIVTPEQIAGHEMNWAQGNILRHPYRLLNAIVNKVTGEKAIPQVQNLKPPDVPPTLAALLQVTNQALDEIHGSANEGQNLVANISGEAVQKVQQRLDMQDFGYMDNMAKSMRRSGQIWLSMAKDLLAEEGRKMQALDPEGEAKIVTLLQPSIDADGNQVTLNDPTAGNYDVWVDVGPSFTSRRERTVAAISGLLNGTDDPQLKSALTLTAIMNMDGEGLKDIRDFARKRAIEMGVVTPTKEEAAELAQAQEQRPPDPNAVFLAASAKKEDALAGKAVADTALSEANRIKALADAAHTRAETHDTTIGTHIAAGNALAAAAAPPQPAAP
jgi:hypothetical protein